MSHENITMTAVEIGSVGLAITLTLNLMGICQWGIRQSADTENYMTAVERAFEYCRITPEASLETDEGEPTKLCYFQRKQRKRF